MTRDPDRTASLLSPGQLAGARPSGPVAGAGLLDRMAFELGTTQLEHLEAAAQALTAGLPHPGWQTIEAPLSALMQALQAVDHDGLRPQGGWWARATGKAHAGIGPFQRQVEAVLAAARGVAAAAAALEDARAAERERQLVEIEFEAQALEQAIAQGERWLRDIRARLASPPPAGDADAQRVWRQDQARADALARRLPLLQAVVAAVAALGAPCRDLAPRRAAAQRELAQDLAATLTVWRDRQGVAVEAAQDGADKPAAAAVSAHEALRRQLLQWTEQHTAARAAELALLETLRRFVQQAGAAKFKYG